MATPEPTTGPTTGPSESTSSPISGPTLAPTTFIPTFAPTFAPTAAPTIPPLEEFVESSTSKLIASACTIMVLVIVGHNIFKHLVNYTSPGLQKNIVRILFMVPFYAFFSLLSLDFPNASPVFDSIRDIYEAFVVYCFLNLMLLYCGGENECVSNIMIEPGVISHVWPLNWCMPEIPLNSRFLRMCKQGTIQFVIIKPIMAILNLIFIASNMENNTGWEITQLVVYNISYTLALYMLVLFYKATKFHPGLRGQRPVLKFVSVKLVVFATYYQSLLVDLAPMNKDTSAALNNFILCCEMVVFAVVQYFAFSWREFRVSGSNTAHVQGMTDDDVDDFDSNVNDVALSNAKDIINIQDVAKDAYYNFNNKYGDHVLIDHGQMSKDYDSPRNSGQAPGFGDSRQSGAQVEMKRFPSTDYEANPFETQVGGFGGRTAKFPVLSDDEDNADHHPPVMETELEVDVSSNPFEQDIHNRFRYEEDPRIAVEKSPSSWVPDFDDHAGAVDGNRNTAAKKTRKPKSKQ